MDTKNYRIKHILLLIIKTLATVVIIAFLIRRLGWSTIVNTINNANPLWLLAGFIIFLISGWVGAMQWHVILKNRGLELPFSRTFKLYFIGMFFNNFIAGGIVGDAIKIASIRSRDGKGKIGLAATVLDRFAGLWAMCGFAVLGSVVLLSRGMLTHGRVTTAVIALFAAFTLFAGIMAFLMSKPIQSLFFRATDKFKICQKLRVREMLTEMLIEVQDYKLLASVGGLASLTQFLRICVHVLTAAALGLLTMENFQYFFIFVPIIAMLMVIPLPFGVRETFGGMLFSLAGFQHEAAYIMGFLASLIGIAASSLGGLLFVTGKISRR